MNMAVHGLDVRELGARQDHQLEMDRHEIFADDVQLRFGQQMVYVGDPAGDGVLNRDHRQVGLALSKRVERILECGAGQRLQIRKHVTAGHVRICAKLALKGDAIGGIGHHGLVRSEKARLAGRKDLARTLKIGGSIDTQGNGVNDCHIDAHAILERPKLLERFAFFKRRGPKRDEALERRAPPGIKPDMVIERAFAIRRGGAGEIKRAQNIASPNGVPITLTMLGLVFSASSEISTAIVARSAADRASGMHRPANGLGLDGGNIALNVENDIGFAIGIEFHCRLEHPVRSGLVIIAGHHRFKAPRLRRHRRSRANQWRRRPGRHLRVQPGARPGRPSARR
jgi:hypothetical protein